MITLNLSIKGLWDYDYFESNFYEGRIVRLLRIIKKKITTGCLRVLPLVLLCPPTSLWGEEQYYYYMSDMLAGELELKIPM